MRRLMAVAAVVGLATAGLGGCGGDDDDAGSGAGSGSGAGRAFVERVEASIAAENEQDAEAFLDLWTDEGLAEYDVGSREDVLAGESENFGTDPIVVSAMGDPEVDGDTARVEIDAVVGEGDFAKVIFRVAVEGLLVDDEWMLNGFEFLGGPPPADDAEIVEVEADEYVFELDRSSIPAGKAAFHFVNAGEEPHEISLYKAPSASLTIEDAQAALGEVDGSELEDVPDGYEVAHVAFADVDQEMNVTFAEPLEPGTYVLTCYIPQGGFEAEDGTPHIQLGMLALLTVE